MKLLKDTQERADIRAYIVEFGDDEDLSMFDRYCELAPTNFFMGMSVDSFLEWAESNLGRVLTQLEMDSAGKRVAASVSSAYGIPAEPDLEDALTWAECTEFQGSEKQIKWARDIASKNTTAIALAHKQGKAIPTSAKWWIDNRNNIVVSLPL